MRDPTEVERLLRETRWLRRLARGLVADPHTADDVVQDAFVAALRHPPARLAGGTLRPWLASVVRHLVQRRSRREARRAEHEQSVPAGEPAEDPGEVVARAEAHRLVVEAVLSLPEPYRRALLLRFLDDLPLAEVARRTCVPVQTAKTRVRRGLDLLRGKLDAEHGRAAWLALLAVPRTARDPSALPPLVLTMSTKKLLTSLAAVAAACVALLLLVAGPPRAAPAMSDDLVTAARAQVAAVAEPASFEALERSGVPAPATPSSVPAPPWTVRGRLVEEETELPIAGAHVALRCVPSLLAAPPAELDTTTSGPDGAFVLRGADIADAMRVEVEVTAAPRARVRQTVELDRPGLAPRAPDIGYVTVPPGTLVRGTVLDARGDGVPGAELLLAGERFFSERGMSWGWRGATRAGTSAPDGAFALAEPIAPSTGSDVLLVAAHARGLGWTRIEGIRRWHHVIDDVHVALRAGFDLDVHVVDAEGAAASDVEVRAWPQDAPLGFRGTPALGPLAERLTARTDAFGRARLAALPAELDWTVLAAPSTPRFRSVEVQDATAGSTRAVEIPLHPTGLLTVHGLVTDPAGQPVAGADVEIAEPRAASGEDGRFELAVPRSPHPQRITARKDGFAPGHQSLFCPIGPDAPDTAHIEVRLRPTAAPDVPAAPPERPAAADVVVRIRDPQGAAIEPAWATLREDGAGPAAQKSGVARIGRVAFRDVAAGTYRLTVNTIDGHELVDELDVPPAATLVEHTIVDVARHTLSVTLTCSDEPPEAAPRLRASLGQRGQRAQLADPQTGATCSALALPFPAPDAPVRFAIEAFDPSRPLELAVLSDDRTWIASRYIAAAEPPFSVELTLTRAAHLRVVSTTPWPSHAFAIHLRRANEPFGDPLQSVGGPQGRTTLLDWSLPPGLWHWRIDHIGDLELEPPLTGALQLLAGQTATLTIDPPR